MYDNSIYYKLPSHFQVAVFINIYFSGRVFMDNWLIFCTKNNYTYCLGERIFYKRHNMFKLKKAGAYV